MVTFFLILLSLIFRGRASRLRCSRLRVVVLVARAAVCSAGRRWIGRPRALWHAPTAIFLSYTADEWFFSYGVPTWRLSTPLFQNVGHIALQAQKSLRACSTVSTGLRESRTQESTHRFYRFRTPLRVLCVCVCVCVCVFCAFFSQKRPFRWPSAGVHAPFLLKKSGKT